MLDSGCIKQKIKKLILLRVFLGKMKYCSHFHVPFLSTPLCKVFIIVSLSKNMNSEIIKLTLYNVKKYPPFINRKFVMVMKLLRKIHHLKYEWKWFSCPFPLVSNRELERAWRWNKRLFNGSTKTHHLLYT